MRAMHHRVVADIGKELPVKRVIQDVDAFLDTLAKKLEQVSTSDSTDEFQYCSVDHRRRCLSSA